MPGPCRESQFEPSPGGAFRCRWGAANPERSKTLGSKRKLCFVATDLTFLVELLYELSNRPDAVFVKYSIEPKEGMHLGRCFLNDDRAVGELWQKYKVHPKLMCSVQDDDWSIGFRKPGPRS